MRINGVRVISMKRRGSIGGSRRGDVDHDGLERRVKALQELVLPDEECVAGGLDGLFRETADYIACLQMQVKVMQIMLRVLCDPDQ
ncbi:Transcription factor UPBEAT1 [Acorus calamus]|uniref:Transcription factor UPBEAT1 n=1 Tax=Acorus calamus TaxID=4465 RepID=A0AAV9CZ52_ACOCL|nr:Transcription factor UPBEAT1 [Acorus calamus]